MRHLLKSFPPIRYLLTIRDIVAEIRAHARERSHVDKELFRIQLLATPRYASDPRRLNHFEAQVFSQNGEDGVIAEIFRRIGEADRTFVECGVGNGLVNNTTYLLQKGWRGAWFEANEASAVAIRRTFRQPLEDGQLTLARQRLTMENAAQAFRAAGVPREFDLLSIDIDRNTPFLWKGLAAFRPRVVVAEYNASFPPSDAWTVEYAEDGDWNRTLYFGGSLKALEQLGAELGYALVGCETTGVNAFFVRSDLVGTSFSEPFTAEHHYEPPRYYLVRTWGHPRCFTDRPPRQGRNYPLPTAGRRSLTAT
ncbi:MAG: hypothetical protein ABR499_12150 [Gemmatimonadaceae bacterium]